MPARFAPKPSSCDKFPIVRVDLRPKGQDLHSYALHVEGSWGEYGMGTAHFGSAKRPRMDMPRIQMHWDRVYILTLVTCFWVAAAELTYLLA